jgi:protein arginine kinase
MLSLRELDDRAGWFSRPGEDYDVAVSSRVRLARNLSVLPFPHQASEDERQEVVQGVVEAVAKSATKAGQRFARVDLGQCDRHERGKLVERNLVSHEVAAAAAGTVVVRDDQELAVSINDIDHLRVISFKPGRSVVETYREAESLDGELESLLPYAVSLDLGYLTTELTNLGTGLRASVMLHLPGLARKRSLQRAFRGLAETGIAVRGFRNRENGSLGDMFQIANQVTLGVSEEEILAKLEGATQQLVHYERQARNELVRQPSVEDRVYRAYGLLAYARRMSDLEAIEELSWLRFGVAMGIINAVELADATSLFFLTQKSHVTVAAEKPGRDSTEGALDDWRAWIIRRGLGSDGE